MKCPKCHARMEAGYIDHHTWFSIMPRESKYQRAFARVSAWFSRRAAHSLIAHRCPSCTHVEFTAP